MSDDEKCFSFLRTFGFMNIEEVKCSSCSADVHECIRNGSKGQKLIHVRCSNYLCRKSHTLRSMSPFLGPPKCRLSPLQVMEIVHMFANTKLSLEKVSNQIGQSKPIVWNWFMKCREICEKAMKKEPKLVGMPESAIQIDE